MRILLVSYFFPPFNVVGAVRAAKFAKYFERFGHEVWVVSARAQPFAEGLALESNPAHVRYAHWVNVNAPVEVVMGGRQKIATTGYGGGQGVGLIRRAGQLYKTLVHSPDAQLGWVPFAIAEGRRMLSEAKFDLIYASAPPFSGLIAAARIARQTGVPWVAEFRDLWTMNNAYSYPGWRHKLESILERRTLASAAAIVTVSEPLAAQLRTAFKQRVVAIANGFDPENQHDVSGAPALPTERLNLVYTGMLYPEHYELDALAKAFALLKGRGLGEKVHASFFGRYLGAARAAMSRHGVGEMMSAHEPVPYHASLALQRAADVLLMFPWGRSVDQGVMSTKVYEYLGARRRILAVGSPDADASRLVVCRNAGFASRDPAQIAAYLEEAITIKSSDGTLPELESCCAAGLTREERMRELELFLKSLIEHKRAA